MRALERGSHLITDAKVAVDYRSLFGLHHKEG